jgi:hypothetical protein
MLELRTHSTLIIGALPEKNFLYDIGVHVDPANSGSSASQANDRMIGGHILGLQRLLVNRSWSNSSNSTTTRGALPLGDISKFFIL